jgi:hypothetical protein
MKVIATEFDGTLCRNGLKHGVQENIDYVKFHKKAGWEVTLITGRQGADLQEALDWCQRRGVTVDYVNRSPDWYTDKRGVIGGKVYCDKFLSGEQVTFKTEGETNADSSIRWTR